MIQMLAFVVALVATLSTETPAGELWVGAASGAVALALCFLRLTTDMYWLWSNAGELASWTSGCTLVLGLFCAPDPSQFLAAAAAGAVVSWILYIAWSLTEHFRDRAQEWVREALATARSTDT